MAWRPVFFRIVSPCRRSQLPITRYRKYERELLTHSPGSWTLPFEEPGRKSSLFRGLDKLHLPFLVRNLNVLFISSFHLVHFQPSRSSCYSNFGFLYMSIGVSFFVENHDHTVSISIHGRRGRFLSYSRLTFIVFVRLPNFSLPIGPCPPRFTRTLLISRRCFLSTDVGKSEHLVNIWKRGSNRIRMMVVVPSL